MHGLRLSDPRQLLDVTKRSTTRRHGVRRQPKANQTHEIVAPRLQIARGERHAHPPAASPMRRRASPPIFPAKHPPECNLSITRSPTRALFSPHRSSSTHGTRPPRAGPSVHRRDVASHSTLRAASRPPVHRPAEDTVWVDCFYYGFYIEKSRLPAFQASLRQQQAMHQQHQITPAVKAM